MALKSTVYKVNLQVADMDRDYYADHALTIASHPSENEERLMMRLLAFALNAHERLEFANGLTDQDEPDLWLRALDGEVSLWLQVGQPDERSLVKACGRAAAVRVYNAKTTTRAWWESAAGKLAKFRNLEVWAVDPAAAAAMAAMAGERSLNLLYTIQDGEVWLRDDKDAVRIEPVRLNPSGS